MAVLRKESALQAQPHLQLIVSRQLVVGMYAADGADFARHPVGGMFYGHWQVPMPPIAGMHYDWVHARRIPIGGMRYGDPEASAWMAIGT